MFKRLQERRQFDAAAAEMEAAIRLGPESWAVNKEAGRFYLMRRDLDAATRHYEKAVEIMDTDFHAWAMLSSCYQALGDSAEAPRGRQEDGVRSAAGRPAGSQQRGRTWHPGRRICLLGEKEKTREWIDRALLIDPDNLNMRYNFACVLAGHLGDKDAAIKMLQSDVGGRRGISGPDRRNRYGLRLHSRRPEIPENDCRREEAARDRG